MSEETTLNGHTSLDPAEWVAASEAQTLLGCGSQKLSKLALAQRIERKHDGAQFVYSLSSLKAYAGDETDEQPQKLTPGNTELVAMLKAAQGHAEASFRMVHEPAKALTEFYREELARARARIERLEAAHDANVQAREAALTEEHTRKLNETMALKRQERWDAAFDVLKQTGPAILMQVVETIGESGDPSKKAAFRLMQRLTPERLAELLKTDAVDADERTLIAEILREQSERAKAKADADAAKAEPASSEPAEPASSPAPKPKRPRKRGGKDRAHGHE